jgi:hypothetical protein
MRLKSVHLDRKISATARLPKRSTVVESPAGRSVHPSDLSQPQRQQENYQASQASYIQGPQAQAHYNGSPYTSHQPYLPHPSSTYLPQLGKLPLNFHNNRPPLSRNQTEVMIVEESGPSSPTEGNPPFPTLEDGITLADLPQIMEVAQAREQRRSLPRENSIPYIAELSPVELAIVKHCAVLALTRSPLKDQLDLDEVLEMVETKKAGFWKTLFNKSDKKNIKKKGSSS